MSDPYWLKEAKLIPEGKKSRIKCCKQDNSMIVSNSSTCYSAYCFRCGFKAYRRHKDRTIKQVIQSMAEKDFVDSKILQLPEDFVSILFSPDTAQHWILQYGIGLDLADEYGIGYSPKMSRVILPVYEDKILKYCQARALNGEQPKYLNQESPSSQVLFWSNNKFINDEYISYVIITEDILSTIKVGEVNPAVCIMGTHMTAERARQIADKYNAVLIWTDNDTAGLKGRTEIKKQLQLQGLSMIKHITTVDDPKKHSLNAIQYQLDQVDWFNN